MKTDNQSAEKDRMSAVETIRAEMSGHVRLLATPASPGESVKACIRRVSSRTGLGFGQVRRLWYSEWRIVPAHIADKIREAVNAHERRLDAELATLRARTYALTHHSSDPEFYSQRVAETYPPVAERSRKTGEITQ